MPNVFILIFLSLTALNTHGTVYFSQQEAMELAFGNDAQIEMRQLFPAEEEIQKIQSIARVKLDSRMLTVYVGRKNNDLLGYAAIETHTVRTKPETLLVVLSSSGELTKVEVLAFHEPPEYQPPATWYTRLFKRSVGDLQYGISIQGITGATLSTRSALDSVKKVLAVYQVMLKSGDN